jgi:hypothetical protein
MYLYNLISVLPINKNSPYIRDLLKDDLDNLQGWRYVVSKSSAAVRSAEALRAADATEVAYLSSNPILCVPSQVL